MIDGAKKGIFSFIDEIQPEICAMSDDLFDNPEIGLQEHRSSGILVDYLQKHGFSVTSGIGGLETAFRATYKKGKSGPKIGLLCEYDALENIGHACGHHMQGPAVIGAALALKECCEEEHEIVVYGTPAEETVGGKIEMLKQGCFQDIDVALMMHGSPTTTTDVKSMAMSNFDVTFHGTSAHAALAPEKGRSAFDGILLLFQGIEFLREHVLDDTRMHYTVTDSGGPANVVPKRATARFSLRSYDRAYLDEVIKRFKKIVQGAALMTETEAEIQEAKSLDNKIPVLSLNDILMKNAAILDAPRITPPREKTGSTDFGNVMYRVPGSCIRVAFVPEGTSSHSDGYLTAGKSQEAHEAVVLGAKILAASAFDLISSPEALERIKEEFDSARRKSYRG